MTNQYFRTGYTVVEAAQYALAEYADNPWVVRGEEVPQWLIDAGNNDLIAPEFLGEDYWYLRVSTPKGPAYAGPDDWVARTSSGELLVITAKEMAKDYQPDLDHGDGA
ncbi:hypothetical protein [Streptomyces sp. EN16]|uniref:hypothetical protein n=1 Tax=Streptomyces sp. EN16 TaxID=212773 RepID=UPI000851EE99|nr:hypothetical protein [Streptomyces sp. EN16]